MLRFLRLLCLSPANKNFLKDQSSLQETGHKKWSWLRSEDQRLGGSTQTEAGSSPSDPDTSALLSSIYLAKQHVPKTTEKLPLQGSTEP